MRQFLCFSILVATHPVGLRRLIATAGSVVCLALFLTFPTVALGQGQFAGVYFGTFSGTHDNGQFSVFVRINGVAIVTFYDAVDEVGGINENVGINPDGSFAKTNIDGKGTSVSGTFTATSVTGQFVTSDGSVGNFAGSKISNIGFLRTAGGYYKGSLSGVVFANGVPQFSTSGNLFAIVGANGTTFGFGVASGGGEIAETGGFFSINSGGTMSGTLLDGTIINGSINTTNLTANGTFSVSFVINGILVVHSGTWSVTRQLPLPNRAPVAVNDNYSIVANSFLPVTATSGVLSNDSDPEGDPLNAQLATGPSRGTLALSANGGFTYEPERRFSGTDTFTYRATDGLANSNLATVTITVEPTKVVAMPWLLLLLLDGS